jgi:MarR family transcriptional regulator, lower aerobic nicotinate degradation pathway regulator
MKYELLQQVVGHLEQFENESIGQQNDLPHFVAYLNQQLVKENSPAASNAEAKVEKHETIEALLAQLVAFNYRYAKVYIKKGLEHSPLINLDDFGYLAGIWRTGGCTKTEIIERNIHEKTTGMEIIKRLYNNGLITQTDDLTDRRSKQLQITEKGTSLLLHSLEQMHKASQVIAGNLTAAERMQLLYLLQKLHLFHNPLFLNQREASLEKLLESIPTSEQR